MSTNVADVFNIPVSPALEDERVPQIYAAMVAIMRDATAIAKGERNKQQGFDYRGIDSVYNSLHGVFAKHGVFTTSEILERNREERPSKSGGMLIYTSLRMRYHFWATDGSRVSTNVEGEGMDSGDKSSNKAMAIAHKYALLQALMIPTADTKDPDAESYEIAAPAISDKEKKTLELECTKAINDAHTLEELRAAKAVARGFAMQCQDTAMWERFKQQTADIAIVIKEKERAG